MASHLGVSLRIGRRRAVVTHPGRGDVSTITLFPAPLKRRAPMHPLAGQRAPQDLLVDPGALELQYHGRRPDYDDPAQRVSFGTSGHRGTPLDGSFTESHILAISQAISEYRVASGITGPLFLGKDTHAVSRPAERTALEVFAANGVAVVIQ